MLLNVLHHARVRCIRCDKRGPVGGGPCACTVDGVDITHHADAGYCPHPHKPKFGDGRRPGDWGARPKAGDPGESKAPPSSAQWGPKAWAAIHRAALDLPRPEFARAVRRLPIPCGDCRRHYLRYLADHPPEDAADPFAWSVTLHNAVNARLGKPLLTEAQARAVWGE